LLLAAVTRARADGSGTIGRVAADGGAPTAPGVRKAGIRDGSFEVGGVVGLVAWDSDLGLERCWLYGGEVGHRFPALAQRLHLAFRGGYKGCITHLATPSHRRVDMALIDVGFEYGIRLQPWLQPYAVVGGGFLLADETPSGGRTQPRTCFLGGGGVVVTLGAYVYVDLSLRLWSFENFQFRGWTGRAGNTWNPVLSLAVGGEI
jgi:hypothetical protein